MTANSDQYPIGDGQASLDQLLSMPQEESLRRRLRQFKGGNQTRMELIEPESNAAPHSLLNFSSNNYLGLAQNPKVLAAAESALREGGLGAGASPLISGHSPVHEALLQSLCDWKGCEAALVFPCGYSANLGLLSALISRHDEVLSDRLNHASIADGLSLKSSQLKRYRHRDLAQLEELLASPSKGRARWIVTDGIFSMDGTLAPLPEMHQLAKRFGATLIVDDAHGCGLIGPKGRGTVAHFGLEGQPEILQVGTLSKALGGQGGFVTGSRKLVDFLINKARPFVYSTALALPTAAGVQAAVKLIQSSEGETLRSMRFARMSYLRDALLAMGLEIVGEDLAPMLAIVIGEAQEALDKSKHLFEQGIFAPAIRPPTVPQGQSRIRITPMATHTQEDMDCLLRAIELWKRN